MADIEILHNPKCSKSRSALELLRARGVEPKVRLYLESPLSMEELRALLARLRLPVQAIVRREEAAYREAQLDDQKLDDEALLAAIAAQPRLLQRPIVIRGERAVIGRPPENILLLVSDEAPSQPH